MKTVHNYLVEKMYDELNRRSTSSRLRIDGPIRINSFGTVFMTHKFVSRMTRQDYYLMYLVEGRLTFRFETESLDLRAGDFIIIPPFCKMTYEERHGNKITYYYTHFSGTDVPRFLEKLGFVDLPQSYTVGSLNEVQEEYNRLSDSYNKGGDLIDEIVAAGFQKILIYLAQKLNEPVELPPPHNAILYIKRSLGEQIKVSRLAEIENMSESRFYTVFKKTVGKSPVDYINDLRIARACEFILSMPMMSISEIGATVGFTDNCFFSKHFKKRVGISPSQYRKSGGTLPQKQDVFI